MTHGLPLALPELWARVEERLELVNRILHPLGSANDLPPHPVNVLAFLAAVDRRIGAWDEQHCVRLGMKERLACFCNQPLSKSYRVNVQKLLQEGLCCIRQHNVFETPLQLPEPQCHPGAEVSNRGYSC